MSMSIARPSYELVQYSKNIVDNGTNLKSPLSSDLKKTPYNPLQWGLENGKNFTLGAYQYLTRGLPIAWLTSIVANSLIRSPATDIRLPATEDLGCQTFHILSQQSKGTPGGLFTVVCIIAPIFEEVIFRSILQKNILQHLPQWIARKISPSSEKIVETKTGTILRVAISSMAFGLSHYANTALLGPRYVFVQIATATLMGVSFGLIKESKIGLAGAIGAHFINNFFALTIDQIRCSNS